MADHVYKIREVPRGQRWKFFWDYYRIPTIAAIFGIIAVIFILQSTVFAPKTDITLLTATQTYVASETWGQTQQALCLMPLDVNGDGKVLVEINVNHIDPTLSESDLRSYVAVQTKLTASLSTAESALQIVDEKTIPFFREEELLGTYAELPDLMGHNLEEEIVIPLKELTPFKEIQDLPEGLYMTLRPKEAMQLRDDEKKLKNYKQQIDALLMMMQS